MITCLKDYTFINIRQMRTSVNEDYHLEGWIFIKIVGCFVIRKD
jgi:hypothetical protein